MSFRVVLPQLKAFCKKYIMFVIIMEDDNCKCCHDTINCVSRHIGKMVIVLSIFGIVASVLVSLDYINASGILLGVMNFIELIGRLAYEKLQKHFDLVDNENENLKKKLTMKFSDNSTIMTEINEPDKFDTIYATSFNVNIPTATAAE